MEVKLSEKALLLVQADQSPPGWLAFLLLFVRTCSLHRSELCDSSPPCLTSKSIPSAAPCCFFYYRHYLNRQVEQRRQLDDKPSVTSASQRPWLDASGLNEPGGRVDAGKHKCTAYLQCLTGRLWPQPKSTIRLFLGAERLGGWR